MPAKYKGYIAAAALVLSAILGVAIPPELLSSVIAAVTTI